MNSMLLKENEFRNLVKLSMIKFKLCHIFFLSLKLADQVPNGGNQTHQKTNDPSSSSDPEDNAALEEWAAIRIQNAFRRYKVM
jgi:hypothetical protein